jgi:ADP-ribosylglycohydrolase
MDPALLEDRFTGLLLGTAVGDALGLPAEGISPWRARRLFPGEWRHRFLPGRGMLSDDTEHAILTAQALLAHSDSVESFRSSLAWRLRGWFLGLPVGIGLATGRAILKLWVGIPADRSGVFSAGNGPAMRSPVIGARFAEQTDQLRAFTEASTRMTHTDPRAATGALAAAALAGWCIRRQPDTPLDVAEVFSLMQGAGRPDDSEWQSILNGMRESFEQKISVADYATRLGAANGVSGYMYRTIPVAVYAWMRHFGDFRTTLVSVLDLGGDTDTVGAIVGALAGAVTGARGIPTEWIDGIRDWPRGVPLLRELARRLAHAETGGEPVRYFWPGVFPRNLLFLVVVLLHGFRRLAPPY